MNIISRLTLVQVEQFLGDVLELLPVVLGQGTDTVLVHRLRQVQHFIAGLHQTLGERGLLHLT